MVLAVVFWVDRTENDLCNRHLVVRSYPASPSSGLAAHHRPAGEPREVVHRPRAVEFGDKHRRVLPSVVVISRCGCWYPPVGQRCPAPAPAASGSVSTCGCGANISAISEDSAAPWACSITGWRT